MGMMRRGRNREREWETALCSRSGATTHTSPRELTASTRARSPSEKWPSSLHTRIRGFLSATSRMPPLLRLAAQALDGIHAGVAGASAQLLLDAQQLVVLGHAIRARRRARLDLSTVERHRQVRDGGVLGLTRAVAHH